MIEMLNELNKEIIQRIEYLMDDEKCGESMSDKTRDVLIKENQMFLARVQGLMLLELNSDLDKPDPTNWLGKWAKSKETINNKMNNGEN
jgi:hypothetical protein